jgi:phage gp29-like protein
MPSRGASSATLARDVLTQSVTQWTPGIKPTWTISEVRNALRQHAEGDFSLSAQLVETMGEDDLIPGVLDKRTDALLGSDFELCPVEEPNKQLSTRLAAKYGGSSWYSICPEDELEDFDRWLVMLGVAIGTLDWSRGVAWKATFRTLHPQFLRWDGFRRKWLYSSEAGVEEVTPGDGKWVLLSRGNRGWMKGAVRPLAIPWISKQLTIRDWNRYNERHGLPIIKAYAPAIAEEGDTLQFWDDVRGIASETVAQLPTHLDDHGAKFDLDLLEAKDQSFTSFKELLDRSDRRIMVHLLGSNLSTEITTQGSQAASKVHRGVEQAKAAADEKKFSTGIREQVLYPVIAINQAVVMEVIPWPHWDVAPPEDDKANAEAAKVFGEALVQFDKAGYEVENLDEMSERYGLKLKKREPIAPAALPAGPAIPANPAPALPTAAE